MKILTKVFCKWHKIWWPYENCIFKWLWFRTCWAWGSLRRVTACGWLWLCLRGRNLGKSVVCGLLWTQQTDNTGPPGPGMGLYQFWWMPFGLTGAPSLFQRVMDKIFWGLSFVTTYIDDVLIHSQNEEVHKQHLRQVFQCLQETGLTLRGRKCHIRLLEVSFLGHIFSGSGISPNPKKIKPFQDWPPTADVKAMRQFLGLASYYRWYIPCFAEIAYPLHKLTQKGVPFHWTTDCADAFSQLKSKLVQPPVLAYPRFDPEAMTFVLQSDVSATGIGAVLEQDCHVVAFASRVLTNSEWQYSVIQKECLAAVYATKQFRHYLLGRHF